MGPIYIETPYTLKVSINFFLVTFIDIFRMPWPKVGYIYGLNELIYNKYFCFMPLQKNNH